MALGFAHDIRPLFTDMDLAHMKDFGVAVPGQLGEQADHRAENRRLE